MCDFNKIAGWLIAAQVIFLAMLITLAVAVFNSASVWLAALNIPLMVGLILAAAGATALASLALNEANNCKASACGDAAGSLAGWLTAFVAQLAVVTAALIALAILAPLPIGGAVAVGVFVIYLLTITVGLSGVIENGVASAASAFNECQVKNNASSSTTAVVFIWILAIATGIVVIVATIGGAASGYVPYGFPA